MTATLTAPPPTGDGRLWLLARNADTADIASHLAVDAIGTEQVQGREVVRVRRTITGNLAFPRMTTGGGRISQGALGWVQADWPAWVRVDEGESLSVGDFASFESTAARGHVQAASNFHSGHVVLAVIESEPRRVMLAHHAHSFGKAHFARLRFPTGIGSGDFQAANARVEAGWSGHAGSGNHVVNNFPISSNYMFSADNDDIGVGLFDTGSRQYHLVQMEP